MTDEAARERAYDLAELHGCSDHYHPPCNQCYEQAEQEKA